MAALTQALHMHGTPSHILIATGEPTDNAGGKLCLSSHLTIPAHLSLDLGGINSSLQNVRGQQKKIVIGN